MCRSTLGEGAFEDVFRYSLRLYPNLGDESLDGSKDESCYVTDGWWLPELGERTTLADCAMAQKRMEQEHGMSSFRVGVPTCSALSWRRMAPRSAGLLCGAQGCPWGRCDSVVIPLAHVEQRPAGRGALVALVGRAVSV